ncbi:alpha/beta fold hydrolase [Spirillospora sp. CA-255316]
MAVYVLVHGAWHGGWCWRDVASRLREAGHDVRTPTLTGLGDRVHLYDPGIGLRTHVDDIVNLLEYEDLREVVLVGHSYGGLVVRETADRSPGRVSRLVLVDAWAGRDGESLDDRAPRFFLDWIASVTADGTIPAPPAAAAGVTDPEQAAWVEPRLTPQPRRTFSDPTRLTGAVDAIPCRAVLCTPDGPMPFPGIAKEFGWDAAELDAGHDAMVTAPAELAGLLLEGG